MNTARFANRDEIRAGFSRAMSQMYKQEVPLYGKLMELVAEVNDEVMSHDGQVRDSLTRTGEIQRLDMERHGAIRVGTAQELSTLARLFAVMGMQPVGYYDLTPAGVPVHSTAFRAVHEQALQVSPFRVFTSLLRLELIESAGLREFAESVLSKRAIFTPRAIELIEKHEADGGLNESDAADFIQQALETFRWHSTATVSLDEYKQLNAQHRLVADVVAFRGPHINHLTPRTLDIDRVQAQMPGKGITPKAVVEGPPRRHCPILLRQTSFKALEEAITFVGQSGNESGSHSARFGEIEQRGAALTPKGRELYDQLLNSARDALGEFPNEGNAVRYAGLLEQSFKAFPDSYADMRTEGLAYFRYFPTERGLAARGHLPADLEQLIEAGHVRFEPLVYEDFLPVSAAGIFQSNLGDDAQSHYATDSNQEDFQRALGRTTINELKLYADTQQRSVAQCAEVLRLEALEL
ncbi:VOC family protein [Pseudomonas sp. v388]|uniref:2-oxoadipate dioxygenase/decarboxylase HglS n=1 Tax=Pseudomonas sp. v388 TaxID=2479849 RepID=UPI000F7B00ED|nr:VOC family protein [Pseudomonas sp. v388]RRV07474.1 VOC family protein [Pseudomonas sp. v388]